MSIARVHGLCLAAFVVLGCGPATPAPPEGETCSSRGSDGGTCPPRCAEGACADEEACTDCAGECGPCPNHPDLVVQDVAMQPAAPVEGDLVGFSAMVHNAGTGATPAGVVLRVAFAVNGTQVAWSETSPLSLAPGASRTLTTAGGAGGSEAWVAPAGSSTVRAWVDDLEQIAESDESNNQLDRVVTASKKRPPVAACPAPGSYQAPVAVGTVTNTAMNEVSGLAASRRSPGFLYAHNDSGDSARVFALDARGGFVGSFTVTGATAVDWEDAATGPCPAGSCLFVGDHGDNTASRADCAVYRMPEPDLAGGVRGGSLLAEKFPFAYPDGPRDAESLMVHPTTGEIYIISKSLLGLSNVYRFPTPLRPGVKVTLVKVAELRLPLSASALATAASIHPCGDRFLLRTYNRIYEYRAAAGATLRGCLPGDPDHPARAVRASRRSGGVPPRRHGLLHAERGNWAALVLHGRPVEGSRGH